MCSVKTNSLEEGTKVQGYVASVWAISSVVGPALGGVFVDFLNWRWIFFVNVPLALVAGWMISRHFHENVERVKHKVDVSGAVLLTLGSSLLILGLLEGGVLWSWVSLPGVGVPVLGVALVVAFGFVERRAAAPGVGFPRLALVLVVGLASAERGAPEPILPTWVLKNRLVVTTGLASLAV